MQKIPLTSVLGWVGVVCILSAYAANSFSLLSSQSLLYLILNIVGSVGIVVEAKQKKDLPALFLNIIWASIACIGILKTTMKI
jgi:hypothetical protein